MNSTKPNTKPAAQIHAPSTGVLWKNRESISLRNATGRAAVNTVNTLPIGNRRYSRLEICATGLLALVLLAASFAGGAEVAPAPDAIAKPIAIESGPHYTVWKTASGGFTELACGLNFWDGTGWARSQETISLGNGYGFATNGAHAAVFPPSITEGVDYWDP